MDERRVRGRELASNPPTAAYQILPQPTSHKHLQGTHPRRVEHAEEWLDEGTEIGHQVAVLHHTRRDGEGHGLIGRELGRRGGEVRCPQQPVQELELHRLKHLPPH
jgi:hypothetical protein